MILETERLILRHYRESDLEDYYNVLSDADNLYYLDDIVVRTMDEAQQGLNEAINYTESGKKRLFGVIIKGRSNIIGGVGYDITDETPAERIGHMGWFIITEHQNKGYITEAVKRLLVYAFTEDNCVRITTGCYKENLPTQKVMRKVGFRQEADKTKAQWHDGEMKDRLEFAINRDEFSV